MRTLLSVLVLLLPAPALACGGLFCSAAQPLPVQQDAERILFEIHPDDTISATVEIRYSGTPDAFAWVVPVPDTPGLGVVPQDALAALDSATAPVFTGQRTTCHELPESGCNSAQGVAAAMPLGALPALALTGCPASYGDDYGDYGYDTGIEVETLPQVGPYLSEVVSSDDPTLIFDWLINNDYLLTEAMRPKIEEYSTMGMKFLAMKLAAGFDATAITPIRMTYPGTAPMVPLVLTAVGAEPEMDVLVFIGHTRRWQAENFANFRVDPADLRVDPNTAQNNYRPLLSWLIDQRGGEAFATEFAGDAASALNGRFWDLGEVDDWLAEVTTIPYLTRMRTRISASEMTTDPRFEPSDGGTLPATLDLSSVPPIEVCLNDDGLAPCGQTYCGPGARCAPSDAFGPGCACPEGTAARTVTSNDPLVPDTVYCEDLDADLFADVALDLPDVCASEDCGEGFCVGINGIPACVCDEGAAAFASGGCRFVDTTLGPEQLIAPVPGSVEAEPPASAALLGLLLLLPLAWVRRAAR